MSLLFLLTRCPREGRCFPIAPSSFYPHHTNPQPRQEGRRRCSDTPPPSSHLSETTGMSVFFSTERRILHLHLPTESWGTSPPGASFNIIVCGLLWVTSIFVLSPSPRSLPLSLGSDSFSQASVCTKGPLRGRPWDAAFDLGF